MLIEAKEKKDGPQMTQLVGVAVDGGNNSVKSCVIFNGQEYILKMSSNIAMGSFSDTQAARSGHGEKIDSNARAMIKKKEFFLEQDNGIEEMVGDIAGRHSLSANTGRGYAARYWEGYTLKYIQVSIAAHLPPGIYHAIVTTGLPAETWGKENNEKVRNNLVGTHLYKVNGLQYTLIIESKEHVKIMKEGAAVIRARAMFAGITGYFGGGDIGGGTTDVHTYFADANGKIDAIAGMSGGIEVGTERIIDIAQELFQRNKNTTLTFTYDERQLLIKAYAACKDAKSPNLAIYPTITSKRNSPVTPAELHSWMGSGVKYVSEKIKGKLSDLWREGYKGPVGDRLKEIVLFGGGTYSLDTEMKQMLDDLIILPQPDLQNLLTYKAMTLAFMKEKGLVN